MATVSYNGRLLIPCPFIDISKQYLFNDDQSKAGQVFNITVKGKIVAWKGSPSSAQVFGTSGTLPDESIAASARLGAILRKQEAIRTLFATDGLSFEVQSSDGSAPLKCNPRVKSINYPNGQWYDTCDYEIQMEADIVYGLGAFEDSTNYYISKASEEWNLEAADDKNRTYRLTHQLNATGKRFFNTAGTLVREAWENARLWVVDQLGINNDRLTSSGVLDLTGFAAYNYGRSNSTNELNGTYQVQETWLCYDGGTAIEDFEVNTRISEDRRTSVSVQGTITGLETRNNTNRALIQTRYAAASGKFDEVSSVLFNRAQNYSNTTLNTTPVSYTIGRNSVNGVITYNYEYDNRQTNVITGALSETITLQYRNSSDVFARIPILGRAAGPILQGMGTINEMGQTLNIEAVLSVATQGGSNTKPSTNALVASFYPVATQVFVESDQESWSPYTGRYSRSVSWVFQS